jgi:replicative superfamily II helicase
MRGRAGRKGQDTAGETFIVCRPDEAAAVDALLTAPLPSVASALVAPAGADSADHARLARAVLETVATGLATSLASIGDFLAATLLHHTHAPTAPSDALVGTTLAALAAQGLVCAAGDGYYAATKVGRATVAAGFAPADGLFLAAELARALQAFNLESDVHICYHFTPLHAAAASAAPPVDWKLLRDQLEALDEPSLRAALFCGVNPALVHRLAQGVSSLSRGGGVRVDEPEEDRARVHRRFYVSLMLRRLINEAPVHRVAREFGVARGFVQSLATTCRGFAATTAAFCRVMGWSGLAVLVEHYSWRLDVGVAEELAGLARLPWVRSVTARVFWQHGLRSIEAVADAPVERVLAVLIAALPQRVRRAELDAMQRRLRGRAETVVAAARRLWDADCRDLDLE